MSNIKHLARLFSIRPFSHHREPRPRHHDPHSLLKEDPIQTLSDLWVKTFSHKTPPKPFSNLTGFLSKLDLWVLAYQRTHADVTGTLPNRNAIPRSVLSSLLSLRNAVVSGDFVWNVSGRDCFLYGPNESPSVSNTKLTRNLVSGLGECCFQDCVVQEVLLMVLEPIFDPRFSAKSHGFRPSRNAHTVIRTIRSNFAGYLWFLKGDLSEFLDNVDADVVMGFVEKGVRDNKVLDLIRSGLQKPVRRPMKGRIGNKEKKVKKRKRDLKDNEAKPDPYWLRTFYDFSPEEASKVPRYGYCGILSPLLANVCLDELDHMMENRIIEYFCPSKLDSLWKASLSDTCHVPSWPEFVPSCGMEQSRKMDYIRYGSHFLIGVRGPREDLLQIRKEIIEFCKRKYGLCLDISKLEVEHVTRGIQFLDHIICHRVIHPTLRYTSTGGKIVSEKGVGTLLSVTASLQQCIRHFRRLKFVKGDKDPEPLPCTAMLYSGQAHTNAQMNKFLETMADWYQYADNRKKIVGFCAYVIRSSLAKLYAARYRLKSRAKVYKIASRDLSRPLRQSANTSVPEYSDLLRLGLVDPIEGVQFSHMSLIPSCDYTPFPRNWVPDHERVFCEYSKLQDPKFFCELQRSIKKHVLSLPQDQLTEIVWDYKTLGVCNLSNLKKQMVFPSEEVTTVTPPPRVLPSTAKIK